MTTERFLQPRVVLPFLAVVFLAVLLLTPDATGNDYDRRLTTRSTNPGAASGIYDVASRLGWRVKRQDTPFTGDKGQHDPLDSTAVYAVLAPIQPLSNGDVRALLGAVRRGAGLIMVADSGDPLSDSLNLGHSASGSAIKVDAVDTVGCGDRPAPPLIRFVSNWMYSLKRLDTLPLPDDTVTFIATEGPPRSQPVTPRSTAAAPPFTDGKSAGIGVSGRGLLRTRGRLGSGVLGIPVGRGRVVAVSDPDFLRNDVIRNCGRDIGPRMITALDWASRGGRPPVIFDEFHQGYGRHPNPFTAGAHFLAATALGHTILQALLGGVLLIVALGVRAIPPRTMRHIERRSPLEHVDALARAYEQVGATRTVARHLVSGLRRRHDRGAGRAAAPAGAALDPDERFLGGIASVHPATSEATRVILAAERAPVPSADLPLVADAVDRIDDVFPQAAIASPAMSSTPKL